MIRHIELTSPNISWSLKAWCFNSGSSLPNFRAFIHQADKRLTTRYHGISKPRDSSIDFSNRFGFRQAPRQHCCRDACQILELYNDKCKSNPVASRLCEIWRWYVLKIRIYDFKTTGILIYFHRIVIIMNADGAISYHQPTFTQFGQIIVTRREKKLDLKAQVSNVYASVFKEC